MCRRAECCWPCRRCWPPGCCAYTEQFYALPKGFYGIDSIFLLAGADGAWRASALWNNYAIKPQASGAICWAWTASRKCGRYGISWKSYAGKRDGRPAGRRHLAQEWIAQQVGRRTVFLCRRARARLSRGADAVAAALRGPRAVMSAGHDRLLDQCHGRPALPVHQPRSRSGADCHSASEPDAVSGRSRWRSRRSNKRRLDARSAAALVHAGLRPGRLQSGVVRPDASESGLRF